MNTIEKAAPQQPVETVEQFSAPLAPIDLVHRAIISGANIEVVEKVMGLVERREASQARRAFDAAMADAKAQIKVIPKSRQVDFTSGKGRTQYKYEDLADIARAVDPVLGQFGLSYRWRTAALTPDTIAVTCIVSHRDGHSEETTVPGNHDGSGNKNSIQAVGSAITYLQRYTLKAALGLAASEDDDGQAGGKPPAASAPVRSADEYIDSWHIYLEDASSAAEVIAKWKDEAVLRGRIKWPDLSEVTQLTKQVTQRIEKLKKDDKEPDLITQRYKAEDS